VVKSDKIKAASLPLAAFFVLCREPCDFNTCMVCVSACAFKLGCIAMPENVKCADCGFLGLRSARTRDIVEAEESIRQGSGMPSDNNGWFYDDKPLCLR